MKGFETMAKIAKKSKTVKIIEKLALGAAFAVLLAFFVFFACGIYDDLTSYQFSGHIRISGENYFPFEFKYSNKAEQVGEYKKNPVYAVTDDPEHNFIVLVYPDGHEVTFAAQRAINMIGKDGTSLVDHASAPTVAFVGGEKTDDNELLQLFARLGSYDYTDTTVMNTDETLEGFLPVWIGRKRSPVAYEEVGYLCKINNKWVYAKYRSTLHTADETEITGYELYCSTIPEDYARIISHADVESIKNLRSFTVEEAAENQE